MVRGQGGSASRCQFDGGLEIGSNEDSRGQSKGVGVERSVHCAAAVGILVQYIQHPHLGCASSVVVCVHANYVPLPRRQVPSGYQRPGERRRHHQSFEWDVDRPRERRPLNIFRFLSSTLAARSSFAALPTPTRAQTPFAKPPSHGRAAGPSPAPPPFRSRTASLLTLQFLPLPGHDAKSLVTSLTDR